MLITPTSQHAGPPPTSALGLALDAAHARLDAALSDLRTLVAAGELCPDAARDFEHEYAERHLRRVAEIEESADLAGASLL